MSSLRRRGRSVQINVDTYVDVDLGEVLEELETEDLREELGRREARTKRGAEGPSGGTEINLKLASWDADKLRDAIRTDDGRRAIDILKEHLS